MKVIEINSTTGTTSVSIYLVPRINPATADTLTVEIRNEINDLTENLNNSFTYINNYFLLNLDNSSNYFEVNNKYEINIINNGLTIYEGKLICLEVGTNIQDYKNTVITNKKLEF